MSIALDGLPGAELIAQGVSDLAAGAQTIEALLVAIARPRLLRLGIEVPGAPIPEAELALYRQLRATHPSDAYSRYNSLLRRLIKFGRAAEQRASRERALRSDAG